MHYLILGLIISQLYIFLLDKETVLPFLYLTLDIPASPLFKVSQQGNTCSRSAIKFQNNILGVLGKQRELNDTQRHSSRVFIFNFEGRARSMGKFPFKNKVIRETSMNVAIVSLLLTFSKDSTTVRQSGFLLLM